MTSNSSSDSSAGDAHGVLLRRLRGKSGRGDPNPNFHYLTRLRRNEDGWFSDNEIFWSTALDETPSFCSCNGLVYIDLHGEQMMICNPTTKEFITLPPCPQPPSPQGCKAMAVYKAIGFGLGLDSESDDFKVVRIATYLKQEIREDGPFGRPMLVFAGLLEDRIELYSLNSDSWEVLPCPNEFRNFDGTGAYVDGKYYWVAYLGPADFSSKPNLILHSFHFASESLGASIKLPPLPTISNRPNDRSHYRVVEYVGSLGVVCYELDGGTGESKSFRLLLWEEQEQQWRTEFHIRLSSVRRPLGFSKDGRHLFLEGEKEHKERGPRPVFHFVKPDPVFLFVYDFFSKELKKLDICEAPGVMEIVSYCESGSCIDPC